MSIERQERSPSFRTRQKTAKINHNSKLLPTDFFPKALSQSPKKRIEEGPTSAQVLEEWYERDESKQKQRPQHNRISANRLTASRIKLCAIQQPPSIQKKKSAGDYYNKIVQEKGITLIRPKKIEYTKESAKKPAQKNQIYARQLKQSEQKLVRVIRSQSKAKRRNETPQSIKKISIQRKSFNKRSKQSQNNEVTVGFDGMITFSRFK